MTTQPETQSKSASTAVTLMIGVAIGGLGIPAITGAFSVGSAQASTFSATLATACLNSNSSEDIKLPDGGRSFVVRGDITGTVTETLPDAGQLVRSVRKNVSWAGTECDAALISRAVESLSK